jgi:hypothetical protein
MDSDRMPDTSLEDLEPEALDAEDGIDDEDDADDAEGSAEDAPARAPDPSRIAQHVGKFSDRAVQRVVGGNAFLRGTTSRASRSRTTTRSAPRARARAFVGRRATASTWRRCSSRFAIASARRGLGCPTARPLRRRRRPTQRRSSRRLPPRPARS